MKIKNIFLLQKSDRQVLLFLLTLAVLACLAFLFRTTQHEDDPWKQLSKG